MSLQDVLGSTLQINTQRLYMPQISWRIVCAAGSNMIMTTVCVVRNVCAGLAESRLALTPRATLVSQE